MRTEIRQKENTANSKTISNKMIKQLIKKVFGKKI